MAPKSRCGCNARRSVKEDPGDVCKAFALGLSGSAVEEAGVGGGREQHWGRVTHRDSIGGTGYQNVTAWITNFASFSNRTGNLLASTYITTTSVNTIVKILNPAR
ncbi:hypothetical protein M6B38_307755 [Iris pallida]|uniref:Uncharacterized protein n=1 Tax=Iris pallida TaxID=29817 RepID=A0AAX6HKK0_IRIPA|nr:hypothetical protein M6B38_307755 [Iris pallida]